METTDTKVKAYFWGNRLDQIIEQMSTQGIPDGLDPVAFGKELAVRLKTEIPPYTDSKPVRDCAGEKICGEKTAFYATQMETFLNNTIADTDGFCKYVRRKWHRYLQAKLMVLVSDIIRMFANMEKHETDGRNEYAVEVARKLAKTLDEI